MIDRYLRRLGVEREPPSVDALARLHRAHVERVPYETLWIQQGEAWDVDPSASAARIATTDRGGYCFHLNGAFAELLRGLGYDVRLHVGGVHGPDGPAEADLTNHLVLTVRGLPTDDHPAGVWYVDVGLGDALHEPVPLRPAAFEQPPFHLSLERTPGGVGDWHLTHDPAGAFPGMVWRSRPAGIDRFRARHRWLSTAPESGFVRVLTLQRRDGRGVDVVKGLTYRRVGADPVDTVLETKADLEAVAGDVFGISAPIADDLWARLHRAHEDWLRTERSEGGSPAERAPARPTVMGPGRSPGGGLRAC